MPSTAAGGQVGLPRGAGRDRCRWRGAARQLDLRPLPDCPERAARGAAARRSCSPRVMWWNVRRWSARKARLMQRDRLYAMLSQINQAIVRSRIPTLLPRSAASPWSKANSSSRGSRGARPATTSIAQYGDPIYLEALGRTKRS